MLLIRALPLALFASALIAPPSAFALASTVESGMEVRGVVDLDGLGPNPSVSNLLESVSTPPFTVSQIDIDDSAPGVFSYFSSADIGLLELKVLGSVSNNGTDPLSDIEVGILRVSSEVRDVLTLNSTLTDPYDVTFEMDVDGAITGSGNASANSLIDFGLLGQANGSDSALYGISTINDTLTVTRTVSGATVDMDFTAFLSLNIGEVDPGSTVTGALDNTATFRLILPEGVTLANSASGTFGVPIPVPEPTTWAMMLCGLAVVARAVSKSRRG
jgi:hypothetical protein